MAAITGTVAADTLSRRLYGDGDDDSLSAGLSGSSQGSYLDGGAGDDSLSGQGGADTLIGRLFRHPRRTPGPASGP